MIIKLTHTELKEALDDYLIDKGLSFEIGDILIDLDNDGNGFCLEDGLLEIRELVNNECLTEEEKEEPEKLERKFKVGDEIKVLADYSFFKKKETYTIFKVNDGGIWVEDDDGDNIRFSFDDTDFELVEKTKSNYMTSHEMKERLRNGEDPIEISINKWNRMNPEFIDIDFFNEYCHDTTCAVCDDCDDCCLNLNGLHCSNIGHPWDNMRTASKTNDMEKFNANKQQLIKILEKALVEKQNEEVEAVEADDIPF